VQTTKFKDVLNFLGSDLDIDGHGTTEKVQPQRCFAKGTASLLEIRVCLGEEDEFISKTAQAQIKAALAKKPDATVYSYSGQRHAF
jgi:dienelactone hydrolase